MSCPTLTRAERPGLLWYNGFHGYSPRWEYEPDLDVISKVVQETLGLSSDECNVAFLKAGAFNKAYAVQVKDEKNKYIMRISLPVDPKNKTASQVATHKWLRLNKTNIPVPEIIAFDDSHNNPIGFEWILMQYMPGQCLWNKWRKMPWEDKIALVEEMADCQVELTKSTFKGIGSLRETETVIAPGHLVAIEFCLGAYFDFHVPRGPFRCARDWVKSLTEIIIQDFIQDIKKAKDDEDDEHDLDELDHLEACLKTAKRLAGTIEQVFPDEEAESTVLQHGDLSYHNVIVDDNNKLCGIIDWELAFTKPVWAATAATQFPRFLKGRNRKKMPDPDSYAPPNSDIDGRDSLDGEGKSTLYWDDLMEYEETELRKVYRDYMDERLCPSVVRNDDDDDDNDDSTDNSTNNSTNDSTDDGDDDSDNDSDDSSTDLSDDDDDDDDNALNMRMDFFRAIRWCRMGWNGGRVKGWLDEIEKGRIVGLRI